MAMTPTTTPAAIASVEVVVFDPGTTKNYKELMHEFITFFLGTGVLVPRHSAGGVGTYMHTYVVHIIYNYGFCL